MSMMNELHDLAANAKGLEICGIINKAHKAVVITNTSDTPGSSFLCDIPDASDVVYIFHTHPSGTPELSEADIECSDRLGIPFLVVTSFGFEVYNPLTS